MKQEQVLTRLFGSSQKIWKSTTGQRNPNLKRKHKIRLHSLKKQIMKMGLEAPKQHPHKERNCPLVRMFCLCFIFLSICVIILTLLFSNLVTERRDAQMDFISFLVSVMAGLVANLICKWFDDGNKKQ